MEDVGTREQAEERGPLGQLSSGMSFFFISDAPTYLARFPWGARLDGEFIKGRIIKTPSPSQTPSFPGLTGESRKKLDARLRPEGMTRKQECNFKMC